jgi:hypothetical protein
VNGSLKKMQSENWEQEPQKLMSGRAKRKKNKENNVLSDENSKRASCN